MHQKWPLHVGTRYLWCYVLYILITVVHKHVVFPSRINKEVTVIGRNAEQADIFLDSSKSKALISRLHARIISSHNKVGKPVFKICDTSLNGTYVNDVKISDTVEIMPGDTLTFGHLRGAVLDPGTFSQQTNSEFRFKVRKVKTYNLYFGVNWGINVKMNTIYNYMATYSQQP